MNRKLSGFTLVEMIVVMAIMSVAASMVVPSIISTTNTKLTASTRTVMADLLYAQSQAYTNQTNYYVVFTPASGSNPAKYDLQSPLGTSVARPVGSSPATMGNPTAQLPYATLGALSTGTSPLTLGFDTLGQPFTLSGGSTIIPTTPILVPMQSLDGTCTMNLSVQPFTGEVTAQ